MSDNLGGAVKRYFPNTVDGQVTFSKDAHKFVADIHIHVGRGIVLQSHGEAGEPYPAFDAGLQKLTRQLNRYKQRLVEHHHKAEEPVEVASYVLESDDDKEIANDQPMIVAEMPTTVALLTVSEAVMRMDLADLPALLFKNSAHGGLNMVYRRNDGNIGWVDPAGAGNTKKA